jgi:hypothetical protein
MTARPIFFGMVRWNRTSLAAKKHEEVDCRDSALFCQSTNSITAADNVILPARRRQHWLEYDPVAFAVLLIGIGFVALIVLTI